MEGTRGTSWGIISRSGGRRRRRKCTLSDTILQRTLSDWCDGSGIHSNGLEPNGEHGNEVII